MSVVWHHPPGDFAPEAAVAALRAAPRFLPFDEPLLRFTDALSKRLLGDAEARHQPELVALAYWLRPAAVRRLRDGWTPEPDVRRVPAGVVFHVPPANVDTLFAYSLVVSLLCGNANIVRVPSRRSATMTRLLEHLLSVAREQPAVGERLAVVAYGHDAETTRALSLACDLRVLWGGDRAIDVLREAPLAPSGRELVFPDRTSFTAVSSAAYRATDDAGRDDLAERYANDIFWFDQNACASPRVAFWIGPSEAELRGDLYTRIAASARRRGLTPTPGASIRKHVLAHVVALETSASAWTRFDDLEVLTIEPNALAAVRSAPVHSGVWFEAELDELRTLARWTDRRDQTLTTFGFDPAEIDALIAEAAGRGLDRVVPVGEALAFDVVWDGIDLLRGFTRAIRVRST